MPPTSMDAVYDHLRLWTANFNQLMCNAIGVSCLVTMQYTPEEPFSALSAESKFNDLDASLSTMLSVMEDLQYMLSAMGKSANDYRALVAELHRKTQAASPVALRSAQHAAGDGVEGSAVDAEGVRTGLGPRE